MQGESYLEWHLFISNSELHSTATHTQEGQSSGNGHEERDGEEDGQSEDEENMDLDEGNTDEENVDEDEDEENMDDDVNMEDENVGKDSDEEDADSFRSGPTSDRGCRDIRDDNYDGGLMFGVDEGMDLDFPQMDSDNDESRIGSTSRGSPANSVVTRLRVPSLVAKRPWRRLRRNATVAKRTATKNSVGASISVLAMTVQ